MNNYLKEFQIFLSHLKDNSQLIKTLIMNDFKKQYLGSYFGLIWAFVQPITFIAVIWFVFEIGFRASPNTNGIPFFLWLISGMIPWFFFANGFGSGTNAIIDNSFLVKKVAFRTSILPIVQIGSAFLIHLVLVCLLILSFLLYGYTPDLYWLQIFYYLFCSVILLIGLSWLTSSIRVFIKDIGNLIAVLIQIGFWATPIFWSLELVPDKYQYIIKSNPMYYITDGFRDTFINKVWFWEKGYENLYFLTFTSILFIGGAIVFRKLRPHFGDVL
jgi:lipopolysaccharide transport system permease protein/teichoic acid transport system permease protein